jgi:rhodanese-related sulfurtransferase
MLAIPSNPKNKTMSTKIRLTNILLLIVILITACQAEETPQIGIEASMGGAPYRVVSVPELQTMLENKDFLMVNVYTPWEKDIPQTDLRLAYDQIEANLGQLPADKDAKILVYCLSGGMSKKAVATLISQGYTNIWMLDGGTTSWEAAGLPFE